ncbi:hypothetical protein PC120_g22975 [Phytophthora cactorum]|nr:hypothetical protein PC120_g22975 [Phytophthora cactorum]
MTRVRVYAFKVRKERRRVLLSGRCVAFAARRREGGTARHAKEGATASGEWSESSATGCRHSHPPTTASTPSPNLQNTPQLPDPNSLLGKACGTRRVPLLARCENFRTEEGIEEAKHQRTLTASRSHRAATPDSSGESSEVSEASVESDGGDPPDALDSPDVTTPAGLGAVQNVVQQTLINVSWNNTGGQGRHRCHRRRDPV